MENIKGKIHSIESMGTLDGPGLRTVIFFQGCPLRCKFCHNVDAVPREGGEEINVNDLVKKVLRNKKYWGETGGVTFSGGEPLYQPQFAWSLAKELKLQEVHLVIDTCFFVSWMIVEEFLDLVDLWMISLKHMNSEVHKDLTSQDNKVILKNVKKLDQEVDGEKIRIRFLVIPGVTDTKENLNETLEFVNQIKNFEKLEVLGYGAHGKHKWIENFGKYDFDDVPEAKVEDIERVVEFFAGNLGEDIIVYQ